MRCLQEKGKTMWQILKIFTLGLSGWRLVAFLVAVTAGLGGVYYYVRHQGVEAERNAQRERELAFYKEAVEKSATVAKELEENLANARENVRKLNRRLKDEIDANPIYVECVVPHDGVLVVNDALSGTATSR